MSQAPESTASRYEISFPDDDAAQDQEVCDVVIDGERRRLRFHDYADIYGEPGLYEQLFYAELECASPPTVVGLLAGGLQAEAELMEDLRVLDIGAGNGMVGEELRGLGADQVLGVDIIEAAAEAAERDRPDAYDDYLVADLTALGAEERRALEAFRPNCLMSVAALGFGDIPVHAFTAAFGLLEDEGWVAFCIKEDFLADGDGSGFARLMARALEEGSLVEVARQRYRHRLSATGRPLHYVALVARRRGPIPESWATVAA